MITESSRDSSAVYIVDDEADYRFLVQQVFTRYLPQYKAFLLAGGGALIDHLQMNKKYPALILLDLHMPDMDGQQTLTLLKQTPAWKAIPVVMVTSSSSAQEIQACYDTGANSCLVKPIGIESMRQQLTLTCTYWMDTNRPFTA
jgi:CheY-like chemotaxis protein